MAIDAPAEETQQLDFLVKRLHSLGMDCIALDLTTDELRDVGLWVVRVVTPELVPMSAVYRARFLGYRRIYDYPEKAGFGKLTEADINPAPQPFA
jgi:ribosomal protein S12 methylthiotransferase accessory factor